MPDWTCNSDCTKPGVFAKNGQCNFCSINCQACMGSASNCTSCPTGKYLNLSDNTCVACEPQSGYYQNSTDRTCLKCDDSCLTCNGSTAESCLTCPAGRVLFNGNSCRQPREFKARSTSFKSDLLTGTIEFETEVESKNTSLETGVFRCTKEQLMIVLRKYKGMPVGDSVCPQADSWKVKDIAYRGQTIRIKVDGSDSLESACLLLRAP